MEAETFVTRADQLPVEQLDWGTLQWLCSAKLVPGAQQTIGLCRIDPGRGNPLHYHPNCEEILHVLAGTGRHSIDGQWIELRPGVTVRIPAGVKHNLINEGGDTMVCVIAFSSADRQTVFLDGGA
jgi:quercetin dioxygenase-like cupin family protein